MLNKNIKNMRAILLGIGLWVLTGCAKETSHRDLTAYVNPYIGSKGHGHVFVGANVPFGAVQLGPSQIIRSWDEYGGWDWTSGYNYLSEEILGFTHTHLSGTGIGDLNDILVLPATGKPQLKPMAFEKPETGYGSLFKRENEKTGAGYYRVYLDKYGVTAELTASERVGMHRYRFERADNPHLVVDLKFGMGWDVPVATRFEQVNDTLFMGERFSKGWSQDQRVFFALTTSVPVKKVELIEDTVTVQGKQAAGKATKALLFPALADGEIVVKVALSPVSPENALLNINTEVPHNDFNRLREEAREKWNAHLSRIEIEAPDSVKTIFYTALYHTRFAPSLFNDVNGDYRGSDKEVYKNAGFQNYTTFSLWDTYRAQHPLLTLTDPDRWEDFVQSLVNITEQQGALAMWPLYGSETFCMVGNPAMTVISDAYRKGLVREETALKAFEALYKVSNHPTETKLPLGQKWVKDLKWIPADKIHETVAWGMEYAVADGAFSALAQALGKEEASRYYGERAKLYKAYFDPERKFFNGRFADGSFRSDFNPFRADHRTNDYIEGNAWQYLWMVPHQPYELISMLGGDETFVRRLDEFFALPSELDAEASNDISGLIGQYAHGNEPSHHVTYLYTFAGKPWKTAEKVREIMDKFYTARPDGLIGNEDVGQMSAWYILSSLGFYPANPLSGEFVFGSPLVEKATLKIGKDKTFRVTVKNNSRENKYIQSIRLNGQAYEKLSVSYADIMKGGELEFTMGPKPAVALEKAERPR